MALRKIIIQASVGFSKKKKLPIFVLTSNTYESAGK